jgi:hypothetical protein
VSHGGTTGWEPLKKINISWRHDYHDVHRDERIFQGATRQGRRRAPARHVAGDTLNASKTCGQADCRTVSAQCRPAAHTKYVVTLWSGSTTLGSHAATVPIDPTARRRAKHVSDVARQQDMTRCGSIHTVEDIIRLP